MKTFLVVLALIFSRYIFGQSQGFVNGYVISLKGDTERVEIRINPKKPLEQYTKLLYKTAAGLQKSVKPEKVKGYGFDNNHFITDQYETEYYFYKVLSHGELTLYEIQYEYQVMNELVAKEELFFKKAGSDKYEQIKPKKFKKQLKDAMSANPDMVKKVEEVEDFSNVKMNELFDEYNAWAKTK